MRGALFLFALGVLGGLHGGSEVRGFLSGGSSRLCAARMRGRVSSGRVSSTRGPNPPPEGEGDEEGWGAERGGARREEDAGAPSFKIGNPFTKTFEAGANLRDAIDNALGQLTGAGSTRSRIGYAAETAKIESRMYSQFESEEEVPLVLVVGATGETGRVVVRKLLLRGFRVRVMVRNLYSSTLELLGSGVQYAQGDITKPETIEDAISGVDKVIFCARSRSGDPEKVEYEGLQNLIRIFQDCRVADYGKAYSTKRMAFKFSREKDRSLFNLSRSYDRVTWGANKFGKGTLGGVNAQAFGDIGVESIPLNLDLANYSGLVVRLLGDGKPYRIVLRTSLYEKEGIQYEAEVVSQPNKWQTHRIPFSSFKEFKDGELVPGTAQEVQVDRNDVRQFAIVYRRAPADPSTFIVSVDYIKLFRTQLEPEFVYLSSSLVPFPMLTSSAEYSDAQLKALEAESPEAYWNALAEGSLRRSGLCYTIIRVGRYNNLPGGVKAVTISQEIDSTGDISRADAAELCVSSLLDPRACNLAVYASQSTFAPSAMSPDQDVSSQLARMIPNL